MTDTSRAFLKTPKQPENAQGESILGESKIACIECDLLVTLPVIDAPHKLSCPRCKHVLSIGGANRLQRALPLSFCALLLIPLSLIFPFMSFERAGVTNEITLVQTASVLFTDGSIFLGALVLTFIILAPCILVTCLAMVAWVTSLHRWIPGVKTAARIIYTITSWSMVEVFIIGVFVSLVKIAKMANVELGISLWAYLALSMVLVATISSLDKVLVWQRIAELEKK